MRTVSPSSLSVSLCLALDSPPTLDDCAEVLDREDNATFEWRCSDQETFSYYEASARTPVFLPIGDISASLRATLADWLMQVSAELRLQRQTCQLALQLTDCYLQRTKIPVTKTDYHLLGIASLLLASKFEEVTHPKLTDLRTSSGNAFSIDSIKAQERQLMRVCEWRLMSTTLYQWFTWVTQQWDDFVTNYSNCNESRFWEHDEKSLQLQAQALTLVDAVLLDDYPADYKEIALAILFITVVTQCSELTSEFLTEFEYFLQHAAQVEELAVISMSVQYVSTYLAVGVAPGWNLPCAEAKYRELLSTQTHTPSLSTFVKKRIAAKHPPVSH